MWAKMAESQFGEELTEMKSYTIRPATPNDAHAINIHLRRIAEEPNNTISYSRGEFLRTSDEERERIEGIVAADNSHMLVAVVDNKIIGLCSCFGGVGVERYTAWLGISVHSAWRDQGVGTALTKAMIQWARGNPKIHRFALVVYTHNARAIRLYRKLGFQEEGIQKEAYFKDGRFVDGLMMAMLFNNAQ
jgi:RimJ/RimL family protein N-acetyltransferase